MEVLKIEKGSFLQRQRDKIKALYIVVQGRISVIAKNDSWIIEAGNIIGIMECAKGTFTCDYQAVEDTICYVFSYRQSEDLKKIFAQDSKYTGVFTMAAVKQTAYLIRKYKTNLFMEKKIYQFLLEMLAEYQETGMFYGITDDIFEKVEFTKKLNLPEKIEDWTLEYYEGLSNLSMKTLESFFALDDNIAIGLLLNAGYWMEKAVKLNQDICNYLSMQRDYLCGEKESALLRLYFKLAKAGAAQQIDMEPIRSSVIKIINFSKENELYDKDYLYSIGDKFERFCFALQNRYQAEAESEENSLPEQEERGNYLQQILNYFGYDKEKSQEFKRELEKFYTLPDMLSTDDSVRKLRRNLTQHFYNIYLAVFKKAVEEQQIPRAIRMFLNFGFMEEKMTGAEAADALFNLADNLDACRAENVFTMFEWLKSIYEGKNEPSRSEFDLDYQGHLLELRKMKKITPDQEKLLNRDTWKKVEYEIKNMFVSTNRATYGRVSTFCPILCEYDMIAPIENLLVTAQKINDAIDRVKQIDFSAFYREVIFSNPDKDVLRELIQKEVMPQIILLPNAGCKGMMWQENAGVKKDTPARFAIPILTIEDMDEMAVELVGRYRWEICRRIQGARWNDISERSLTSEYSDYIQYYRKNNGLSPEAKEKVKNAMAKAKNNLRESFVIDYKNWIKYESKGSFRLNKVARDIIFRYCPFVKEIRNELIINPMYRELFEKFEIFNQRKKKHVEIFTDRYMKKGGAITAELQINKDFYDL